jgi:hypothetical protein
MFNDPELDGKYLGTITADFVKVYKFLQEASYQLRVRKISQFPIFIINKKKQNLGEILLPKEKYHLDWNYSFSFLEDLVAKNIIQAKEEFEETYKNPDEFICLLVIDEENDFIKFIYIPFPEE